MQETTPYLVGLNEQQKTAVLHLDGPLMVLAGAGSGKTRVITHRIVHIIHQGVAPHNILAVTFTNKAAKEMRERVDALVHKYPPSDRAVVDSLPLVTTFHSLGVRLLREFHEAMGLRRHFTIYDRADSIRTVRQAIIKADYDPKEFEPKRILGMISRAKGDAITQLAYLDAASSYPEQVAAAVWDKYEAILQAEQALDFDDLLAKTLRLLENNKTIRETLQQRYKYIHVDEYQDTNRVQFSIVEKLAGDTQNICVVGDIDQCLVAGTKVKLADGTTTPIEKIKEGALILSNFGSGDMRPATVSAAFKKNSKVDLITVETLLGKKITSTDNHLHFAGYRLGDSAQTYFVYLMKKESLGWRLGTTCVYTKGQQKPMPGFVQRLNHEHGDALWILETHDDQSSARISEYILSLQHKIPTLPFVARKGSSVGGYVHDQTSLNKVFSAFDTEVSALKLLQQYGLKESCPHHRPQVSNSTRQNILVSLCGDRRGKTPMHRLSIAGSDQETKELLTKAGFAVRSARANSKSWRVEVANKSFTVIREKTNQLSILLPKAIIIETARLGIQEHSDKNNKNSLPCIPAGSIKAGMVMFTETGSYDRVVEVTRHPSEGVAVYDLTINPTHNFVANGLVTHNSIYSWRGADIKNVLQFERHFTRSTTVLLEENYRSTQTIIAASNDIIKKNQNRVEKNVFTNNQEGEKITLYAAMTGYDEAEYIALTAKSLIEGGADPTSIAVLYRTNFQSRSLEEAFLNFAVPYQLLGTKFFERKEVKDVLSYLRLALNPGSNADLARVINEPARGIGKVTLLKIIEGNVASLNKGAQEKLALFDAIMADIEKCAAEKPLSETIKYIMARSGIEAMYREEKTEEALERLENLRELVTLSTRYNELPPLEAVEQLLESAALQSDQDEIKDKEELNAVRLMTVHAAKGLEFAYVFISGLEEGLFPHERLDDGKTDKEEERRLFYVALTRAEKKIFLTYAHMRTIFGSQRINVPSSFLNDISKEHVETGNPIAGHDSSYETTIYLD